MALITPQPLYKDEKPILVTSANRKSPGRVKKGDGRINLRTGLFRRVSRVAMALGNQLNSIRTRKPPAIKNVMPSWSNTGEYTNSKHYDNEYSSYDKVVKSVFPKKQKASVKELPSPKKLSLKKTNSVQELQFVKSDNPDEQDVSCFTVEGFKSNVRYYLNKTTLHGLRYIGDGNISVFERFFWFVAVFSAIVMSAYFIGLLYDRWNTSPMIVSLNPEFAQITSIPFPAITVCNMNQARRSVAEKILEQGSKVDKKLLEGLCNVNNDSATTDIDSTVKGGSWKYFKYFLINVTQPCSQLLAACRWRAETRSCESLFNAALTDEGLCCTFNSVHRDMLFRNPRDISDLNITFPFPAVDWTPEGGYPPNAPANGFPWRPIGVGANLGLTLVLDAAVDEYYCSSTSSVGFKVLLHNPAETPKITDFGDLVPTGEEVRVVVRPRIYDAQEQLKNIKLDKRRCYFSDERRLVYYRTYTQKNCVMECEARLTIERCNCSQYFMPKNSSIRICGMADSKCYVELKIAIEDKLGVNESALLLKTNCDDCYPACYELSYGKDVSSASLGTNILLREDNLAGRSAEYIKENMAVVQFYFSDAAFIRYTKGELFGFTDFLSNTGGLLGLFMGFSFLSFVEILYFLSLRMMCAFYRYSKKNNAAGMGTGTVYPFSQ